LFRHVVKEQLKVPAKIDYLGELRDFVTKVGRRHGFSERVINAFKLSIDEAATNIIKHAYRDWDGDITIRAVVKKNSLTIVLVDQGKYFDPRQVSDPDLQRYVEIGKKGGLGIFIMRRLLDEIDYQKTEDGNELRLVKYRDQVKKRKLAVPAIPMTLKARYWLISIGVFTVVLVMIYFFLFFREGKVITDNYLNRGYDACSDLANDLLGVFTEEQQKQLIEDGSLKDPYIIDNARQSINRFKNSVYRDIMVHAFVTDKDSVILASTDTLQFKFLGQFSLPENALVIKKDVYRYTTLGGKPVLHLIWPVVDQYDHLIATAHFQIDYEKIQSDIKKARFNYFNLALLLWVIGATGLFLLIYIVMNPFRRLAEWVRALGQPGVVEEMDIDTSTEVGEIAQAFSDITRRLKESQKNLAEQERLQKEMQVAQEIQQTLLPSEFPEVEGYEIASYYAAAKEVGGDYFDFVEVDKDTLGIVVADVSGKGVPGSLVMTMIRTALRTEARGVKDAAEVLSRVNDFVINDMKRGMFVTLFYVIIDSRKRRLNYASAGHNPMILYRASTNKTYYLNPRGFPIGISLPDKELFKKSIESDTLALAEDDILIIYTDGVTEAMNGNRELFGEERFLNVIRNYGNLRAEPFVEKLHQELLSFTEGNPQNDDITLVAIKEKTSAEKIEVARAKRAFQLIQEGSSIKEACETVGISTYAYYHKYKEIFEKEGTEKFEVADNEAVLIEAKHLSIEEKTKIYDIIRRFPEFGAKRISDELNTERYGYTKISPAKIYEELVRSRLNTKELREAFIMRGGRKRRIKPPGTPLLTLDGQVIMHRGGFKEPEIEHEEKKEQTVKPAPPKEKIEKKEEQSVSTAEKSDQKKPAIRHEQKEKKREEIEEKRDLLEVGAEELFTVPIEDLLDKRSTKGEDDTATETEGPDSHWQEESLIEEEIIPERIVGEDETEEIANLDIPADPRLHEATDEEELDFAELVQTGGGFDDPEEINHEFAGEVIEDIEAIFEEDSDFEEDSEFGKADLSDPFDEFLEIEDEQGMITASGELDEEIAEQILKNELKEKIDSYDFEELLSEAISWDIKEIEDFSFSGNSNEDMDRDSHKLSFDELLSVIDDEDSYFDEKNDVAHPHKTEEIDVQIKDGTNFQKEKDTLVLEKELSRAVKLYEEQDYSGAIAECEKLALRFPDEIKVQILLGNIYFRSQKYQDAVKVYEQVIEKDPLNVDAYENLGVVYANQGNLMKAIELWEELLKISPEREDIKESIERAKHFLEKS